jgi:predicted amidohydrolase
MSLPRVRAAACHFAPILFEARKSCDKAIGLIHQAARSGANLVVFPESAIPGFPVWSALLPPTRTHDLFQLFTQSSLYVDSEEISAIRQAAAKDKVIVSLGFSEKVRYSTATLFNSNILIGENGELLNHHRKLMPTFFEKLTWSPGDGYGLRVSDTRFGKIGALICGENTNPLARYALMAQGEQIHISTWPAVWPTRDFDDYGISGIDHKSPLESAEEDSQLQPGSGHHAEKSSTSSTTAQPNEHADQSNEQPREQSPVEIVSDVDGGRSPCKGRINVKSIQAIRAKKDGLQNQARQDKSFSSSNYNNLAANRTRAAAHCFEAKCFGISCAGHLDQAAMSQLAELVGGERGLKMMDTLRRSPRAVTQFFDPTGAILPSFSNLPDEALDSLSDEDRILFADLDLNQCVEGKQYHDVVGGYQRFDVFSLMVNRQRYEPAAFVDSGLDAVHSRGDIQKGHPPEADLGSPGNETGQVQNNMRTSAEGDGFGAGR